MRCSFSYNLWQHARFVSYAQVCCPNGMDWDQDKGIFYFIDTADSVVRSYPVDENGVPKRSADGVLVGVREVSLLVRQYPSTQQYICALQSNILFGLQLLCLHKV